MIIIVFLLFVVVFCCYQNDIYQPLNGNVRITDHFPIGINLRVCVEKQTQNAFASNELERVYVCVSHIYFCSPLKYVYIYVAKLSSKCQQRLSILTTTFLHSRELCSVVVSIIKTLCASLYQCVCDMHHFLFLNTYNLVHKL
jgi:hypothetical protein